MRASKKAGVGTGRIGLSVIAVLAVTIGFAMGSQARATVVAYWEFDEGSGYYADSSVGGYLGDLVGFTDISAGVGDPVGGSGWTNGMLNFDNSGSRVQTDFPLSSLANKSFTVEWIASHNDIGQGWSTVTGRDSGDLFYLGKDSGTGAIHANLDAETEGGLGRQFSQLPAINIADGDLHHVAVVFDDDNDTQTLYIDHTFAGTIAGVSGTLGCTGNLWIGADGIYGFGWNGYIDALRISEGVMTTNDFLPTPTPYTPPTPLPEGLVGDWRFDVSADGSPVVDGQLIGNGSNVVASNPANLKNDAGVYYEGGFAYQSPRYATGDSVPDSQRPGFDDSALDTGLYSSEGVIHFDEHGNSGFYDEYPNSDFSIWQRVYRQSATGTNEVISCRKDNWFIYVRGDNGTLDVNFDHTNIGGVLRDAFGGTGPEIAIGEWYDIGVTFEGTGGDSLEDTLKVYVNGKLVGTFTDVSLLTCTANLQLGAAGDYGLEFDGLFDRVMYWNEVVDAQTFVDLSGTTTPEYTPGDANKDGKVDGSDVTILAGNWQKLTDATWDMGDFNGDGKVDGSDVTILAGNWQSGVTASATSVPEPSTIALLFAIFVSLAILRRVNQ